MSCYRTLCMDLMVALGRFILTFALSLTFGIARQRAHKPIGFGAFTFVAVGACALSVTAIILEPENPLPLLGAIMTGVGFLGAGALIKTSDKIFGFTSAASIWLFAVFGLVIGAGQYVLGLIIYCTVWAVILVDRRLEERGIGSYQRRITINTNKVVNEKEIETILRMFTNRFTLVHLEVDKKNSKLLMQYLIEGTKVRLNEIPKKLYEKPWFDSFKVE